MLSAWDSLQGSVRCLSAEKLPVTHICPMMSLLQDAVPIDPQHHPSEGTILSASSEQKPLMLTHKAHLLVQQQPLSFSSCENIL